MFKHYIPYQNKNHYLLCASAYTAADSARFGCFRNRCFKWGYFPEVKRYEDIRMLVETKKKNTILWTGRLIDWKHPEAAVQVADRLRRDGYDFELNIIGNGLLEDEVRQQIVQADLTNQVHLLGSMPPEQVREHMEQAEIFLFTSDRNEGWGAVLNESMNSGCAVVASGAIGSVPFLLKDGENGTIYRDGDANDLYEKVKWLLEHPHERQQMGAAAYRTLAEQWNADVAAKRLLKLIEKLIESPKDTAIFDDGPCSEASIL